jgi:copper(I)-binding protein
LLKWFRQEASPATAPIAAEVGDLAIAKPWARIGTRTPGVVGGYFVLTNRGNEPDRLLSAASPAADSVTIHAIKVVGAEIRVRPLPEGLAIPAGTTFELKPRGYHLQLAGLKQPPTVGTDLAVTVVFQKAGRVDLTLRVEDSDLVGGDIIDGEAHLGR